MVSAITPPGTLRLWETKSGELLLVIQDYTHLLYNLAWSPDGTRLASAGSDSLVTLWEMGRSQAPRVLDGHRWSVYSVMWSPDGSSLASCGDDGVIAFCDMRSDEALRRLRRDRPYERLDITGIRGLTQAQLASFRALGAVEKERA